jgi:pimeloyl-ACP methyl ester carboxylesterase
MVGGTDGDGVEGDGVDGGRVDGEDIDGEGVARDGVDDVRDGLLDVPGARLYYKIRGSGPPLLVLPGGDGTADTSDALAQQLASRWTVICYDRRGLSRSQPRDPAAELSVATHGDDAHQVLAALVSEPAVVLGVSIGGGRAGRAARRPAGRVPRRPLRLDLPAA